MNESAHTNTLARSRGVHRAFRSRLPDAVHGGKHAGIMTTGPQETSADVWRAGGFRETSSDLRDCDGVGRFRDATHSEGALELVSAERFLRRVADGFGNDYTPQRGDWSGVVWAVAMV